MTKPLVIVGGGPVGMSLALALAQAGHRRRDSRPASARSRGRRSAHPGAVARLDADPVCPGCLVADQGHADQKYPCLAAWCSRSNQNFRAGREGGCARLCGLIQQHCHWRWIKRWSEADISFCGESRLLDAAPGEDAITLNLNDGRLKTKLGGLCRRQDRRGSRSRRTRLRPACADLPPDPGTHPHQGTAWERFTSHGPFALLPFENDYAAVYVCKPADAERLQGHAGCRVAGARAERIRPACAIHRRCRGASSIRWACAIVRSRQRSAKSGWAMPRRPCIRSRGRASTWPCATAWRLAHCLTDVADPGAPEVLARYAANRKLDRCGTIGITDSLIRVFSNDDFLLKHARGAALIALDMLPPLRSFLARRMMFGARAW